MFRQKNAESLGRRAAEEEIFLRRPVLASLRLCTAALLFSMTAALPVQAAEDWAAELNTGEAEAAPTDSAIIGMTADEMAAYVEESQSGATGDEEVPDNFVRNRRRLVIREIKFNSDWDTDPTALPAMVDQYKRRTGLDAQALQPRSPLTFDDPELTSWPVIYMTAHNAFTLSDAELKGLQRYIAQGGFLFSDDCLYGFPFGPAFKGEMLKVLPDKKLTPFNHETPVYGNLLRQKHAFENPNEAGLPNVLRTNNFEYIEVDGRMAVLYTPPDLGCMWEISSPPTPSNPLGAGMHNMDDEPGRREAAYRMGVNIFFYVMTH